MKEFRISSSTGKAWDREVCKIRRRGKRKFKKRIKIQEKKIRDARERENVQLKMLVSETANKMESWQVRGVDQ